MPAWLIAAGEWVAGIAAGVTVGWLIVICVVVAGIVVVAVVMSH